MKQSISEIFSKLIINNLAYKTSIFFTNSVVYFDFFLYLCSKIKNIDAMKLIFLLLISTFSLQDDLAELNHEIEVCAEYDMLHEQKIDSLRQLTQQGDSSFQTCLQLFECYASYQFDSAYSYVCRLEHLAQTRGDSNEITIAAIKKAFAYFSAGLFKEANDVLEYAPLLASCERSVQVVYYSTYARLCFDLGTYAGGNFYDTYTRKAIDLLDKEIALLTPADTADYNYAQAMKAMKLGDHTHALRYFEDCLTENNLSEHERAIIYSSMSYPANMLGEKDLALHYMILAAICDLRASVNEGVALRFVASMLHERGMSDEAMNYINHAQDDAISYGARHRQMEVFQILPIIEQDYLIRLRERNRRIYALSACSLVLLIICFIGLMLYSKRNRALGEARQMIEEMNQNLLLANKIKEEYIGSFLCWQSGFINEIEKYQRHVRRAGELRKYDDLQQVPRQADATRCREEFYHRFDEMFLHIFPTFVADFNALLRPEEQIHLKQGELLNTDLRIFALIRLGITQNEVIAEVLNYSVNTIYAYKTKIKGRSNLAGEEFYERVLSIPSFTINQ